MKYTLEIEIPGLPETTNQILSMKLRTRMNRKSYWKKLVWVLCSSKKPQTPLKTARITLIRHSTTRPDPDGLVSSFKHIIDGLVIAKILENDKYENIAFPVYLWELAKPKMGFCKVRVEEI